MQTNMGSSIQEYCKKINRELTTLDLVSLFLTLLFLLFLTFFVYREQKLLVESVVYSKGESLLTEEVSDINLPFGSKYGKTYTFSWCSGSSRISEKNKIIFSGEAEAVSSGRSLSKLCKK